MCSSLGFVCTSSASMTGTHCSGAPWDFISPHEDDPTLWLVASSQTSRSNAHWGTTPQKRPARASGCPNLGTWSPTGFHTWICQSLQELHSELLQQIQVWVLLLYDNNGNTKVTLLVITADTVEVAKIQWGPIHSLRTTLGHDCTLTRSKMQALKRFRHCPKRPSLSSYRPCCLQQWLDGAHKWCCVCHSHKLRYTDRMHIPPV